MSGIIYLASDSLSCFWISFVSGFLIDLDHVLDYYLQEGVNFDVKRFFKICLECRLKHLSVILHSWELLALLWFWIIWFKPGIFWVSFAIGASQHMFFDLVFNRGRVKTHYFYFLSMRLVKGFRFSEFLHKR